MILELCKVVHYVDLGESFQTHIYLKFGFDTAENEPCKVCPIEWCLGRATRPAPPGGNSIFNFHVRPREVANLVDVLFDRGYGFVYGTTEEDFTTVLA